MWIQREITLEPRPRGFHLVTREVLGALPELRELRVGLAHLLLQHTSASLTLNENASPDVRDDFEAYFNAAVPEDAQPVQHATGDVRRRRVAVLGEPPGEPRPLGAEPTG